MLFFKSIVFALPFVASMVSALPAASANADGSVAVEKRQNGIQASEIKNVLANLNNEVVSNMSPHHVYSSAHA